MKESLTASMSEFWLCGDGVCVCCLDAIVMKPGDYRLKVLCMKRPFFLCGVIPGQEQRNSDYLLDRGAAKTIFEPRRAAHTLLKVLGDEGEQAKLLEASEKLARPKAGESIVKKVLEFI